MSKRLQVILPDDEWVSLKALAKRQRTTVAEWVRRALHRAAKEESSRSAEEKLKALMRATLHCFPAPGIEQMNREIEEGYRSGLP